MEAAESGQTSETYQSALFDPLESREAWIKHEGSWYNTAGFLEKSGSRTDVEFLFNHVPSNLPQTLAEATGRSPEDMEELSKEEWRRVRREEVLAGDAESTFRGDIQDVEGLLDGYVVDVGISFKLLRKLDSEELKRCREDLPDPDTGDVRMYTTAEENGDIPVEDVGLLLYIPRESTQQDAEDAFEQTLTYLEGLGEIAAEEYVSG